MPKNTAIQYSRAPATSLKIETGHSYSVEAVRCTQLPKQDILHRFEARSSGTHVIVDGHLTRRQRLFAAPNN